MANSKIILKPIKQQKMILTPKSNIKIVPKPSVPATKAQFTAMNQKFSSKMS